MISQPTVALETAFLNMLDDYERNDPENGIHYSAARSDFASYIQGLQNDERGLFGIVPCSHRWLVTHDGSIVGVVRVRHNLNDAFLANEVGHIGYDVPPSHRGHGYGVAALRGGLQHARELGLPQVVLYADTDNVASWRIIERCDGILTDERHSPHYACLVRRYLIMLKQI